MTVFDQNFLQAILPALLGMDPSFVVPRQGNWFNPQDMMPTPQKPKTWCAFAIEDERPVTLPHYVVDHAPANWSVQHWIATLALQFVGTRAKELATSVGHWLHRADVFTAFCQVDGSVLTDFRLSVVDFFQEGLNSVKAYTMRFSVLYASEIETGQTRTGPGTDMAGFVFKGGAS